MTTEAICLDCQEKYGWTGPPTLNCHLREHRIKDPVQEAREGRTAKRTQAKPPPRRRTTRTPKPAPAAKTRHYPRPEGMWTAQQAADSWGVSPSLITRWARQGKIPGAQLLPVSRTRPQWHVPEGTSKPVQSQKTAAPGEKPPPPEPSQNT